MLAFPSLHLLATSLLSLRVLLVHVCLLEAKLLEGRVCLSCSTLCPYLQQHPAHGDLSQHVLFQDSPTVGLEEGIYVEWGMGLFYVLIVNPVYDVGVEFQEVIIGETGRRVHRFLSGFSFFPLIFSFFVLGSNSGPYTR
jgi:hypothetical protein